MGTSRVAKEKGGEMREIKFRYRIQSLKTEKIATFHKTLDAIETGEMFDFCFDKDEKEIRKFLSRLDLPI